MKLYADVPGMVLAFDDFRQDAVRGHAAEPDPGLPEPTLLRSVHFIAMAVALGDFSSPVDLRHLAARLQHGRIGAEPHGAAEVAAGTALLQLVTLHPLGHQ